MLTSVKYTNQVELVSGNTAKELVSVVADNSRLTDEKAAALRAELNEAVESVLNKHGLALSRQLFRRENSREMSLVIRGSIIDKNGFDALHRDLLEYCHELKFRASIMNASIMCENEEYQISGLDLSTKNHQFRLTSGGQKSSYMPFDTVKAALPNYFY